MTSNNVDSNQASLMENADLKSITSVFQGKTKFMIYVYFKIYGQLTSNQLCDYLQKSKSTIHKHLQDYIDIGILADPQIRDKEGNFLYHLSPAGENIMSNIDTQWDYSAGYTRDFVRTLAEANIYYFNKILLLYNLELKFWKKILKKTENGDFPADVQEVFEKVYSPIRDENGNFIHSNRGIPLSDSKDINTQSYFPEEYTKIYVEKLFQAQKETNFPRDFETLPRIDKDLPPHGEMFVGHFMPIKTILDYLNKKS